MKIPIKRLNKNIIYAIVFIFLFSRYFVTLQSAFPTMVEVWKDYINMSIYILLIVALVKFDLTVKGIALFAVFFLLSLLYQTNEYFSLTHVFFFFISLYLAKLYTLNKKIILGLFFYSGLVYLALLFYLIIDGKGFLHLLNEALYGRNYIGSVITVFILSGLALSTFRSNFLSLFGMAIVLILKFRTSIVSFLLFTFLKYYKNKHFYLFLFTLLVIVEATMGISSIIFKWGEGVSVGGSRTEIWMYYLNFMIDNFPNSLLPYIFTEFDSHKPVYHYLSNETGAYHTIHNLFIDLFYRLGIVFGVVAILLLLLPVIFVKKNKLERNLYIALLIFGMLEPSLGFATNLISLFFYVMLFYLYLNIKFTWRSKFEKNINNNN